MVAPTWNENVKETTMAKLEFAFKRGDILSGEIFAEQIPETWKALKPSCPQH